MKLQNAGTVGLRTVVLYFFTSMCASIQAVITFALFKPAFYQLQVRRACAVNQIAWSVLSAHDCCVAGRGWCAVLPPLTTREALGSCVLATPQPDQEGVISRVALSCGDGYYFGVDPITGASAVVASAS